jgi:hypothetical protein
MRVFKNAWFDKFCRQEGIGDGALCDAIARAGNGLIDADLGGGLLKQRIARVGAGKSGGFRTLIFFRNGSRAVFVFGFAKNDRANLAADEVAAFKRAAKLVLRLSEHHMDVEVQAGRMIEVRCDGEQL